jgi:DNA-binding transcriptional LysR family regulator
MDWQPILFDWNYVRAFLATAETGSFSGAARALKSTQPTVSRQIDALEGSLGVTLFERTTKGPVLTDTGRDLVEHVRAMKDAASLFSIAASGRSQETTGEVSVTASDLLAATVLPRLVVKLRSKAPGIRLRVVASNEVQDLTTRQADIALRHARPDQPDLVAKHITDLRANLYAATHYLDTKGRPETVRELAAFDFVGSPSSGRMISTLGKAGAEGAGIGMVPEVLGESEIGIEKVLPDFASIPFPIWLVTHRELRTNKMIRLVFDFLAREFPRAAR